MVKLRVGKYTLLLGTDTDASQLFDAHLATLSESWSDERRAGNGYYAFELLVHDRSEVPILHLTHSTHRAYGWPEVLMVPETDVLLVASGQTIESFDLAKRIKIERYDDNWAGLWGLSRHGDFVVAQAEVELAVWSLAGKKVWAAFADPPHKYTVDGNVLKLVDFRGKHTFDLGTGTRLSTDPTTTINSPE